MRYLDGTAFLERDLVSYRMCNRRSWRRDELM